MVSSESELGHDRTAGSAEWFDDHWQCSLQQGRFLYPKAVPTTQWELFEREKARHIDLLLDSKCLSAGLVLECGCGTAGMSVYMANRGFEAMATDVSLKALGLAQMNVLENGTAGANARLHLLAADVFVLPFCESSFDLVMSHGLLEHFDRQSLPRVMREMVRVLRPGGLFLADISHGSFSIRKVAECFNLPISLAYYLLRADLDRLRACWKAGFHGFYENRLNAHQWKNELELAALSDVDLTVMRPFPPLALTPSLAGMYVRLMERLVGAWRRFDRAQSWLTRHWGWLYLAHGTKAASNRCS